MISIYENLNPRYDSVYLLQCDDTWTFYNPEDLLEQTFGDWSTSDPDFQPGELLFEADSFDHFRLKYPELFI